MPASGVEKCLVNKLPRLWLPCSLVSFAFWTITFLLGGFGFCTCFLKHLGIWDLCPSVNPSCIQTPGEVCAERLTGPGKHLLNLLILGEVSLLLINFRTDTLSQKHFQCQHSCVDVCMLNGLNSCICFWKIFFCSCSFVVAFTSFCLSCWRRCGCATNGRTWWFPLTGVKAVSRHTLEHDSFVL